MGGSGGQRRGPDETERERCFVAVCGLDPCREDTSDVVDQDVETIQRFAEVTAELLVGANSGVVDGAKLDPVVPCRARSSLTASAPRSSSRPVTITRAPCAASTAAV